MPRMRGLSNVLRRLMCANGKQDLLDINAAWTGWALARIICDNGNARATPRNAFAAMPTLT